MRSRVIRELLTSLRWFALDHAQTDDDALPDSFTALVKSRWGRWVLYTCGDDFIMLARADYDLPKLEPACALCASREYTFDSIELDSFIDYYRNTLALERRQRTERGS